MKPFRKGRSYTGTIVYHAANAKETGRVLTEPFSKGQSCSLSEQKCFAYLSLSLYLQQDHHFETTFRVVTKWSVHRPEQMQYPK